MAKQTKAFSEITPEEVLILIREWFDVYGEPPREVDWNPAQARRRKLWHIVDRFEKDGCWPYSYTVRKLFGGSFQKAVIDAGFYPRHRTAQWEEIPLHARSRYLRGLIDKQGKPTQASSSSSSSSKLRRVK